MRVIHVVFALIWTVVWMISWGLVWGFVFWDIWWVVNSSWARLWWVLTLLVALGLQKEAADKKRKKRFKPYVVR